MIPAKGHSNPLKQELPISNSTILLTVCQGLSIENFTNIFNIFHKKRRKMISREKIPSVSAHLPSQIAESEQKTCFPDPIPIK